MDTLHPNHIISQHGAAFLDHERKKAIEEEYDAPKQAWRKRLDKFAFKFLQTAALQRPIFRPKSSRPRAKSHKPFKVDAKEAHSNLNTKHEAVADIVTPSETGGGRHIGFKSVLSGQVPNRNKDLNVGILYDPKEESIASRYKTPAHPKKHPTVTHKFGFADGAGDNDDELHVDAVPGTYGSGASHGSSLDKSLSGLEIHRDEDFEDDALSDHDEDNTADSDEDYTGCQTDAYSYETSDEDDEDDSDSESWISNPSEDQGENGSHFATSLGQVAKTGLGDMSPMWEEDEDDPLGSRQLHLVEDHRPEDINNSTTSLHHIEAAYSDYTSSESGDNRSCSEDESAGTYSDGADDTSSENEEGVDDGGYTGLPLRKRSSKRDKASIIDPVTPSASVAPSSPEWNLFGSSSSESEVSPSHSAPDAEGPESHLSNPVVLPTYLRPGSIVRRRSKNDHHPYMILHEEQDENGKTIFGASLCTSRPQLRKIKEQYGEAGQIQKHYIYLGGLKANPKGFETGGITMPTDPEIEIQGVPMRLYTYLELGDDT
ncbi:hypothetical protein FGRMN_2999 [Fusarium graminum]|nr:hypothetical protein FGRMN_2999 [Fusarium graminum]